MVAKICHFIIIFVVLLIHETFQDCGKKKKEQQTFFSLFSQLFTAVIHFVIKAKEKKKKSKVLNEK